MNVAIFWTRLKRSIKTARRNLADRIYPDYAKDRENLQLALDASNHYLAVWRGDVKPSPLIAKVMHRLRVEKAVLFDGIEQYELSTGEQWKHYKGTVYEICGFSVREHDQEIVVVYQKPGNTLWASRYNRPWQEFIHKFEKQ